MHLFTADNGVGGLYLSCSGNDCCVVCCLCFSHNCKKCLHSCLFLSYNCRKWSQSCLFLSYNFHCPWRKMSVIILVPCLIFITYLFLFSPPVFFLADHPPYWKTTCTFMVCYWMLQWFEWRGLYLDLSTNLESRRSE